MQRDIIFGLCGLAFVGYYVEGTTANPFSMWRPVCSWGPEQVDTFLPLWVAARGPAFGTLLEAQLACEEYGAECGGVTRSGSQYETRVGTYGAKSPTNESSWVKSCDCKNVRTKKIIVPPLENDDDAEDMCANYHCPRMGADWDYAGQWWTEEIQGIPMESMCRCVKKNCDCTVPMDNDNPDDYNMAHYYFEKDGCMLGWTESYSNSTVTYGTCEGNLGPCPWNDRDESLRTVTSPAHCKVTKVAFQLAGGVSRTDDYNSDQWLGVKLVDEHNNVIEHYSRNTNSNSEFEYHVWDELSGAGCYRVVLHDGQVGSWSHIMLQDVKIWGDAKNKMLQDLRCRLSADDAWTAAGEHLVRFGVERGVDSAAVESSETAMMDIGANYIHNNTESATVVTDVLIMTQYPDVKDVVDCPLGYEKACYWQPDTDGTDWFDTLSTTPWATDVQGVDAALCLKKEPCVPGGYYVQSVNARAGGKDDSVPKTSGGCKFVGRWNPADGGDATSWTSGETGDRWAALYQCKAECPHQTCAKVVLRTMKQSSVPSIDQASAASGDTIEIFKRLPNCHGDLPLDYKTTIGTGENIQDQSSYTFSRAISHSFDSEISTTAKVEAEAGYEFFGNKVKGGVDVSLSLKKNAGFTQSLTQGQTSIKMSSQVSGTSLPCEMTVNPGWVGTLTANITVFEYSTNFVAEADCVDEGGRVIESTQLDGVFRGRSYEAITYCVTKTRLCDSDECTCTSS